MFMGNMHLSFYKTHLYYYAYYIIELFRCNQSINESDAAKLQNTRIPMFPQIKLFFTSLHSFVEYTTSS